MAVVIDRGPKPCRARAADGAVEIGLVNNMPDAALEATERQFIALVESAAVDIPVRLRFFALPGVPRGDRGQEHVARSYAGFDELRESRLDALIVTGTEPRAAALPYEPYWPALTELIDWAERNTVSTIWSCLAAHAAVLHLDGIARHPLADKRIGVFDCATRQAHPLTHGLPLRFVVPHARYNEVREEDLVACGYDVLTRSPQAGVDTFARQGHSLFVFFQGHPEYDAPSLLGEYRRDLGRFLRRERAAYPTMPQGYFDAATEAQLMAFQARAMRDPTERLLVELPVAAMEGQLRDVWRPAAAHIYRNWLTWVAATSAEKSRRVLPIAGGPPGAPRSPLAARHAVPAAAAARRARIRRVDRRRRHDPACGFTGARDRRVSGPA